MSFEFDFDRSLVKVISGGQIGADIAGLRAAKKCGLETGGHAPHGFRTKLGNLPILGSEYNLIETENDNYKVRTDLNVQNSDATLILAVNFNSPGTKLTIRCCEHRCKPYLKIHADVLDLEELTEAIFFIRRHAVKTLNVAGNGILGIEAEVEAFLIQVFQQTRSVI